VPKDLSNWATWYDAANVREVNTEGNLATEAERLDMCLNMVSERLLAGVELCEYTKFSVFLWAAHDVEKWSLRFKKLEELRGELGGANYFKE